MSEILSNILPLILVVGVVVIKLVSGAKSASAQNNNAPTDEQGEDVEEPFIGENFPTIEVMPEPRKPKKKRPKPSNLQKESKQKAVVPVAPVNAIEEEHSSVPAKERIRIKTKSDAKRAIIYSEIFNKKY